VVIIRCCSVCVNDYLLLMDMFIVLGGVVVVCSSVVV